MAKKNNMVHLGVKIPKDMMKQLSFVMDKTERSASWHVRKAIEEYLTKILTG